MHRRLPFASVAAMWMLALPALASDPSPPRIEVHAERTSRPEVVVVHVLVFEKGEDRPHYRILSRVTRGETTSLDSFLSFDESPFPSLLGELSVTDDGRSVDYRLDFVSGVLPLVSVTGSVPVTEE
jgi:hypothetical protein